MVHGLPGLPPRQKLWVFLETALSLCFPVARGQMASQPRRGHPWCASSPGQRSSWPPGAIFPTLPAGPAHSPVQLVHIASVYPRPAGQEPGAEVSTLPHTPLRRPGAMAAASRGRLGMWPSPGTGSCIGHHHRGDTEGRRSTPQMVSVAAVHTVCRGVQCPPVWPAGPEGGQGRC